jgi:hypothetical protein
MRTRNIEIIDDWIKMYRKAKERSEKAIIERNQTIERAIKKIEELEEERSELVGGKE